MVRRTYLDKDVDTKSPEKNLTEKLKDQVKKPLKKTLLGEKNTDRQTNNTLLDDRD